MGWASGTSVFNGVIIAVQANVQDLEARKAIYRIAIEAFQDADWDTLDECLGKDEAYDAVFQEIYPDDDDDWG